MKSIAHTNAAFAAIREGGAVVTWGKAKDGGDSRAIQDYLVDIASLYANAVAFVAVNSRGMVRASWGVPDAGGTIPNTVAELLEQKPVREVVGTLYAFAALFEDGTAARLKMPAFASAGVGLRLGAASHIRKCDRANQRALRT